jgi:large subunit ribosomal protein L4
MKFDVVDTGNKKVGQVDLEDSVFGAQVRPGLFWEAVRMQLANRRRGTHSTKTVSEVNAHKKKPYRQKGTGRARHGSRVAMNMRGGGIVFGPRPRDYSYRMPKKMVKVALRSALSKRTADKALFVVKGWSPEAPNTKAANTTLTGIGATKALIVGSRNDVNLEKSVRNLAHAKFLPVEAINVYDILYYDHLVLTVDAVSALNDRLKTEPSRKEKELAHGVHTV